LHSFSASVGEINGDGVNPSPLLLSGYSLYGTANLGGSSGYGTVFKVSCAPRLCITAADANVILTWPTDFAGFDYSRFNLQETTNPASRVWTSVPAVSTITNGLHTITNLNPDAPRFYRLSQ